MVLVFIKQFLLPSNLMALFILTGMGCLVLKKARRFSSGLLCAGGLVFLVFSNGPVSYYLVRHLEEQSPAFSTDLYPTVFKDIVVLTGHALPDARLPASSSVNSSSAFRILEALRLRHLFPGARIAISGYADVPSIMKKLLLNLGVEEELIDIETQSNSTYQSAFHLKDRFKNRAFILVTSAGHMPRALGAFRSLGMNPTAAPTDYMAKMDPFDGNFLPTPNNLLRSDLAMHEYFGLLWYRLTSRL
jgi:uncharacterized SAM-binding protein YcdF (DUF218 family)